MSICAKCGNHIFGIVEQEPSGSRFKVYFVQCMSCHSPIGIMDYFDNNSLIEKLENKLNKLTNQVEQIGYEVNNIHNLLNK